MLVFLMEVRSTSHLRESTVCHCQGLNKFQVERKLVVMSG